MSIFKNVVRFLRNNNSIQINGRKIDMSDEDLIITIEGDVEDFNVDACHKVIVKGNVKSLSTMSGSVHVEGNIENDVDTMSGNVTANNIHGDVDTMSGNIKVRK